MNKVVLIGRLTADPELKFTQGNGTAVATFTLAIDRRFKKDGAEKEADFVPIVAWNKTAEYVTNYSAKGKMIAVNGRIQTRNYKNKEDRTVYVTEVVAEEVQILEWASKGNDGNTQNNTQGNENYGADITPVNDGDIPF